MSDLITRVRDKVAANLAARAAIQDELDDVLAVCDREDRDLTDAEADALKEARTKIADLDEARADLVARADELQADADARSAADALADKYEPEARSVPVVKVGDEPGTYRRDGEFSYFRDLAMANAPGGGDVRAAERLAAHAGEVRANMNRTDGTGGEFVPPKWLMDEYLAVARAGRITADLTRNLPLPPGTDSINLPRLATGTATAEQADGGSVQKTDATTGSVSGAVTTLAGQQVFAIQLLDQSPLDFDRIVFADLLAALATNVDAYVISKAAIGILNVTGTVAVTYTDASPTVGELYPKVADVVQQVETNRFLPPQAHVMHPRRWAWLLAALDTAGRPLVVPNAQGPTNSFAGFGDVRAEGSVGTLQGLPVYTDPNIPTNLGAGTNEDRIITARFDDLYLFESDIKTRVLFETDADTLSVRLQVWEYAAFIGNRYPKSIGIISGTGLIAPTF